MTASSSTDLISIRRLRKLADPCAAGVWGCKPILDEDIRAAVEYLRTHPDSTRGSLPMYELSPGGGEWRPRDRRRLINRIAWLVVHGWDDPIDIDVGVPSMGCDPEWIVQDGNHRLAAAIYRNDKTIKAECSGEVRLIKKIAWRMSKLA